MLRSILLAVRARVCDRAFFFNSRKSAVIDCAYRHYLDTLYILFEITNHPVCAAKERDPLLMAQPPLLENGGEWTRLATNPSPTPRVATCGTVLING